MRSLLVAAVFFSLLGCAKRYNTEGAGKAATKVNLTGLTAEKLTKTKYDSFKVLCELAIHPHWTHKPLPLVRSEWNVLQDFGDSRTADLWVPLSDSTVVKVKVSLDRLVVLPSLQTRDENGVEFLVKNTPIVHARLEWTHTVGSVKQKGSTPRIALVEGLPAELLQLDTQSEDADQNADIRKIHVGCQIQASPKPQYRDELTRKK